MLKGHSGRKMDPPRKAKVTYNMFLEFLLEQVDVISVQEMQEALAKVVEKLPALADEDGNLDEEKVRKEQE